MPELDLLAIERRVLDATSGPWGIYLDPRQVSTVYSVSSGPAAEGYNMPGGDFDSGDGMIEEDATFIAHAREDVPALIAEVRRAHALIVKLWKVANPTDYPVHDAIRQAGYGSMIFEATR